VENTARRNKVRGTATVRLKNMRVGLEHANSCHDHDGFQASPRQSSYP
jgi:hypothetical protein